MAEPRTRGEMLDHIDGEIAFEEKYQWRIRKNYSLTDAYKKLGLGLSESRLRTWHAIRSLVLEAKDG